MNKLKFWAILILVATVVVLLLLYRDAAKRAKISEHNVEVLMGDNAQLKISDSLNAVANEILILTKDQYERTHQSQVSLIEDLQKKNKSLGLTVNRLEMTISTLLEAKDTIALHPDFDTTAYLAQLTPDQLAQFVRVRGYTYADSMFRFDLRFNAPTYSYPSVIPDTATYSLTVPVEQFFYRVPKFKFLGIRFGTKGIRQIMVSRNKNVTIPYVETVLFTKNKKLKYD